MTIANTIGLLGVSTERTTSFPEFALGTVILAANTSYTYAQATGGAIAAAGTVALTGSFGTTTGSTYTSDVLAPGIAANGYFWAKKVASPF